MSALELLQREVGIVFKKGIEAQAALPKFEVKPIVELEKDAILAKVIIGKKDVDIAALIKALGSSDWVNQGRAFFAQSNPTCPFCQQAVTTSLSQSLTEYFDENYLLDIKSVQNLSKFYNDRSQAIVTQLDVILDLNSPHLNTLELQRCHDQLKLVFETNMRKIYTKIKEPSLIINMSSSESISATIELLLEDAAKAIKKVNSLVLNLNAEKIRLSKEIWNHFVHDFGESLIQFTTLKDDITKAISSLGLRIQDTEKKGDSIKAEISEIERTIISIQPAVDDINGILSAFGFDGFKLITNGSNKSRYRVVRQNGSNATSTLSEGEKSFIVFLYFYQLIQGSFEEKGTTTNRILVFDDPVSSLDSDVLFIVGSLIKKVLSEVKSRNGQIKQVFILTHNIFFHREVSYVRDRSNSSCLPHERFWIVRKISNQSQITLYQQNPIRTSYELLWAEVTDQSRSKVTIQNTLRRIIESYLTIFGGMDRDTIVGMFEGADKQICKSLFSWMNEGSHSMHDDLHISADASSVERYLVIFKQIFEKTHQIGHYNMMTHNAS